MDVVVAKLHVGFKAENKARFKFLRDEKVVQVFPRLGASIQNYIVPFSSYLRRYQLQTTLRHSNLGFPDYRRYMHVKHILQDQSVI